jgi:SAM-dependent methyltransferase
MSKDPAKDFGAIADDYVFFETHSTEAEADTQAYLDRLADWKPPNEAVRMLDFGCGSGTFTARFVEQTGWSSERLELTLVEPAEAVRTLAVERMSKLARSPIAASASVADGVAGAFDIVLANHVFYYVPDVEVHLQRLVAAIAPGGMLLVAIAGRTNALIEFWLAGFGGLGSEVPYNTSEDVAAALERLNVAYDKELVPYRLSFVDTEENRLKLIRFLLAEHLAEMSLDPLIALFDKFSRGDRIEIETASDHYVVGG